MMAQTALKYDVEIKEDGHIELDVPFPAGALVTVFVVAPSDADEWSETDWLQAAARNSAFDFLQDPAEDIYSLADGKPS